MNLNEVLKCVSVLRTADSEWESTEVGYSTLSDQVKSAAYLKIKIKSLINHIKLYGTQYESFFSNSGSEIKWKFKNNKHIKKAPKSFKALWYCSLSVEQTGALSHWVKLENQISEWIVLSNEPVDPVNKSDWILHSHIRLSRLTYSMITVTRVNSSLEG